MVPRQKCQRDPEALLVKKTVNNALARVDLLRDLQAKLHGKIRLCIGIAEKLRKESFEAKTAEVI